MVKQHIYRWNGTNGCTVAVSDQLLGSAWLPLLEQQAALQCALEPRFPVYLRYPFGRGLVACRCAPDLLGGHGAYLMHQLIFDDADDLAALAAVSPLPESLFRSTFPDQPPLPQSLPALNTQSFAGNAETVLGRQLMQRLFSDQEFLLIRFLRALSLAARDKRYSIYVMLPGDEFDVSANGRLFMETILHALPWEDALRLSYCSLLPRSGLSSSSVSFLPENAGHLLNVDDPLSIFLKPSEAMLALPRGALLPDEEPYTALAHVLLGGQADSVAPEKLARAEHPLSMDIPPFEEGMSLRQYFDDWLHELSLRRSELTGDGFRDFVSAQCVPLLSNMVTASEVMDNAQFLAEMSEILTVALKKKLEPALDLPENVLSDLIALLLESIRWRQIDLFDPQCNRLMRQVTAYGVILREEEDNLACLAAARVIYRLLAMNGHVQEALMDMTLLSERFPTRFQALQDCLRRYVHARLDSDVDVIDDSLVLAAMLGYVRFSGSVPDLRLLDKLAEHIGEKQGPKASRHFINLLDKLRRHLHAARAATARRQDIRVALGISLILLLVIGGITLGYLLLNG